MTSFATARDPKTDHLLTPQNAALALIDYQPVQLNSIQSTEKRSLVANISAVARAARLYRLPTVIATVNVATGRNQPTIPQIAEVFPDVVPIDRTAINAWEDTDFVAAVRATGRRKLIMAALWTEVCLVHPALDALAEGYDVYPVVDAMAGASPGAHEAALRRVEQAGARPTSCVQLLCELQRDWSRTETVPGFSEILFTVARH